jgi:hypothetical protein
LLYPPLGEKGPNCVATVRSKQSLIPTRTTIPARDTSHPAGFEDWNKGTWSVSLNAPAGRVSWKYAHFVARQAGTGTLLEYLPKMPKEVELR